MGTALSVMFLTIVLSLCFFIGRPFGFNYRYFLYCLVAIVSFFDIKYLSESISLYDAGFIGAFSFSSLFAIFSISILFCHWAFCAVIDVLLSFLIFLPIALKMSLGIEWFGNDALMAVFQTDMKEAWLFIQDNLSWYYVLFLIVVASGVFVINRNSNVKRNNFEKKCFQVLFPVIALLLTAAISCAKCSGFHYSYMVYESYMRKTHYLKRNFNVDYGIFSKSQFDSLTCVVVVGESLSRDYMSAYGYNVSTTPNIDSLLYKEELLCFDNVYASDIFTVICVPRMLTSESSY